MNEMLALSGPEEAFRNALNAGKFVIQRCTSCNKSVFYPRSVCPHCGDIKLTWFTPSGDGHVYSTTTVRRKAEQGGDYNVCIIELAEGVRLMSAVRGTTADKITIGMKVRARVVEDNGKGLVIFEAK
ncbi:OB-fold domain-containing protein [Bradyrhizobium sp. KB893862 SZCCT0404]|uniref:Zn-ribbon domain-containing OB-fold protein n=1 Tax=Bradyrhizobium sp. KB893862 SZCCT0404 TaxID=2807672 RepID=UPI001BA9610B|nr:OB-fold domain-containing protein [Bradyrhizobium sp. KB893862 SZCCT0404]MBR1177001.1 OB-fold domain-containing protein [Bradyrhizobium sp. KB893862 SZCCT0404]